MTYPIPRNVHAFPPFFLWLPLSAVGTLPVVGLPVASWGERAFCGWLGGSGGRLWMAGGLLWLAGQWQRVFFLQPNCKLLEKGRCSTSVKY
jgi:hypothetical protein